MPTDPTRRRVRPVAGSPRRSSEVRPDRRGPGHGFMSVAPWARLEFRGFNIEAENSRGNWQSRVVQPRHGPRLYQAGRRRHRCSGSPPRGRTGWAYLAETWSAGTIRDRSRLGRATFRGHPKTDRLAAAAGSRGLNAACIEVFRPQDEFTPHPSLR